MLFLGHGGVRGWGNRVLELFRRVGLIILRLVWGEEYVFYVEYASPSSQLEI